MDDPQTIIALSLVALAGIYLARRWWRRASRFVRDSSSACSLCSRRCGGQKEKTLPSSPFDATRPRDRASPEDGRGPR